MTLLWLLIKILKLWNYKKIKQNKKYIVINAVPIQNDIVMILLWLLIIILRLMWLQKKKKKYMIITVPIQYDNKIKTAVILLWLLIII